MTCNPAHPAPGPGGAKVRLGIGSLAAALAVAVSSASAQPDPASAAAILAQVKAATGGAGWDKVRAIAATGEKASFGLTGAYSSAEDLASGRFVRRADYGLLRNAEGLDELGRWRMDNSGAVHPLDSDEARAVAVTEAYLAARGYLFPDRAPATLALLPAATEDGQVFDRVAATPPRGRAVILWIRRSDHRLDRATLELENRRETLRYRDYRPVGGLMLPFDIVTDNDAQAETGEARIARYSLDAAADEAAVGRRPAQPRDAVIASGAAVAYAPFRRDALTGLPIVEARINGVGPLLFILDTGGHDILTPAAAQALGLAQSGAGFSLGAGEGSAPTRYTRVARVTLGEAEMTDQPFVVLDFDLGKAVVADGPLAPISGLIGLELFERFTVTLDTVGGRLALSLPSPEPTAGGAPIRFTSDLPLVQASLDGRKGWFGLDTGNVVDVILFKPWVDAQRSPGWFDVTRDISAAGVGGTVTLRQGRAQRLILAGAEIWNARVLLAADHAGSLSSRGAAGNIGESVLGRYTVTFDYAHERVRLDWPTEP